MLHPLILPMVAHVALAGLLYTLLTVARAPAIWGIGRQADGSNPWAAVEPRISANLSNQFEWPLFFHVACRLLHSAVQILTGNIRLRGVVFTLNFLAVIGLWLCVWIAAAH